MNTFGIAASKNQEGAMRRSLLLLLAAVFIGGCAESPPPQPQQPVQPPPPAVVYSPPPAYQPPAEQPPPPQQYQEPPPQYQQPAPPQDDVDEEEAPPPDSQVVDEYPVGEPEAYAAPAAPPPVYDEGPGYAPWDGAIWVHGYWRWRGEWIWIRGRWARPPMPDYTWCDPYYEVRDGVVVIVDGHWARPGAVFVPPPPAIRVRVVPPRPGYRVVPPPRA